MPTATLADPLDALRELVTEAAEYAGPEDGDSRAIWQTIDAAEAAIADVARALAAIESVRAVLWLDYDGWNPDKEWSADTADAIADALTRAGFGSLAGHGDDCALRCAVDPDTCRADHACDKCAADAG